KAVLDSDLKAELSAHSLYAEAATHCHSVKDYGTRSLFETLMHDEEERLSGNPDRSRPKIGPELYPNMGVEVEMCIAAALVGGEGFAVDATLIQADANKQRSIADQDWHRNRDPARSSRAV